jgi:hypothetical protein
VARPRHELGRAVRSTSALTLIPSVALIQYGTLALKVIAGALAGATVALVVMNHLDSPQVDSPQVAPVVIEPGRNETIVYRQPINKSFARLDQAEDTAELDDPAEPQLLSYYQRPVHTLSYTNPNAERPRSIFEVTRAAITRALVKVGGFVAFTTSKETTVPEIAPRKHTGSIMDEVDDYLWEVYQRLPVKKDGTGDFTWKDPAAARRMGLALQDYVIGGMDPEFREQLYHAGKAMDAAGLQWSMLSAFRDDYRQRLASGFKASVGNSLHGGSRRTGGYGHGRAIDITAADEGTMEDVWRWIDAHGGQYGLNRPMPGADPAHIQQRGDAPRIAMTLRAARVGSALADASIGHHEAQVSAGHKESKKKVASASR